MNKSDQVALPDTDDSCHGKSCKNRKSRGSSALHHFSGQCAAQTQRSADRQVDVAARQDAQQHAAGHDQHICVLQKQVGNVLRVGQSSARQDREENKDDDQRDHHGVLFQ